MAAGIGDTEMARSATGFGGSADLDETFYDGAWGGLFESVGCGSGVSVV